MQSGTARSRRCRAAGMSLGLARGRPAEPARFQAPEVLEESAFRVPGIISAARSGSGLRLPDKGLSSALAASAPIGMTTTTVLSVRTWSTPRQQPRSGHAA
jgi:hypothetical protein